MASHSEETKDSSYCTVIGHDSVEEYSGGYQNMQDLNIKLCSDIRYLKGLLSDYIVKNNKLTRECKHEKDTRTLETRMYKHNISDKDKEIKMLQSYIKDIEKSYEDLKKQNSRVVKGFHNTEEYAKVERELLESKKEIEELKDKILSLEKSIAEKDEQIGRKVTADLKDIIQRGQGEMIKKLNEIETENKNERAKNEMLFRMLNENHEKMVAMMTENNRVQKEMSEKIKELTASSRENETADRTMLEKLQKQIPQNNFGMNHHTTDDQMVHIPLECVTLNREEIESPNPKMVGRSEWLLSGQQSTYTTMREPKHSSVKIFEHVRTSPNKVATQLTSSTFFRKTPEPTQKSSAKKGTIGQPCLETDRHHLPSIPDQKKCFTWSSPNAPWKGYINNQSKR